MSERKDGPETAHYWNPDDLRAIEAAVSADRHTLSATSYYAHSRKFNGSSGCTLPSVHSITVRTHIRRTTHE